MINWALVLVVSADPRVSVRWVHGSGLVNGRHEAEVELWRPLGDERPPAPIWPEPRISGAITIPSERPPDSEERTEGKRNWLVQRRSYLVFPREPGVITVPAMEIRWPDGDAWASISTDPLDRTIALPPGYEDGLAFLVADSVEMTRKVDAPDPLRVGDAVTVTTIIEAEGSDARLIPSVARPTPTAMSATPVDPVLQTGSQRGTRTQTVSLVAERVGPHEIPGAGIWWFDPASERWDRASVEPVTVWADLNPELGLEAAGSLGATFGWLAKWAALAAVPLVALIWLWRGRAIRVPGRDSNPAERAAFRHLVQVAHTKDMRGTLRATYDWLETRKITSLSAFVDRYPEAAEPIRELEGSLSGEPLPNWSPDAYLGALDRTRPRAPGRRGRPKLPRAGR